MPQEPRKYNKRCNKAASARKANCVAGKADGVTKLLRGKEFGCGVASRHLSRRKLRIRRNGHFGRFVMTEVGRKGRCAA